MCVCVEMIARPHDDSTEQVLRDVWWREEDRASEGV